MLQKCCDGIMVSTVSSVDLSQTDCPYQLKDPPLLYIGTDFIVHFCLFRKPKSSYSVHVRNSYADAWHSLCGIFFLLHII